MRCGCAGGRRASGVRRVCLSRLRLERLYHDIARARTQHTFDFLSRPPDARGRRVPGRAGVDPTPHGPHARARALCTTHPQRPQPEATRVAYQRGLLPTATAAMCYVYRHARGDEREGGGSGSACAGGPCTHAAGAAAAAALAAAAAAAAASGA
eukprot:scaffold41398_cov76-Phaeocystis_antarctica.AAC.3